MPMRQTSKISWLKIILIPVFCYLPAFALLWMSVSLKPADISRSGQDVKEVPETGKKNSLQNGAPKTNTSKAETIKVKEAENKINPQQIDKDEIEKLRSELKADLFSSISFPVLFAVASIFAAFAVKDVLTEILKDQEKENIQRELEMKIKKDIVPKVISEKQSNITDSIREIQVYISWLEHELLKIIMTQTIDELKFSLNRGSKPFAKSSLLAIEQLCNRSSITLNTTFNAFEPDQFKVLKQIEHAFLEAKIKSLKLDKTVEERLLSKLAEKPEPPEKDDEEELLMEGEHARMEDLFQLQKSLFLTKLYKLFYEENNDSLKSDLAHLIKIVELSPRNALLEAEKRRRKAEEFNKKSTDEINF